MRESNTSQGQGDNEKLAGNDYILFPRAKDYSNLRSIAQERALQSARGPEPLDPIARKSSMSQRKFSLTDFADQDAGQPVQPLRKNLSIHSVKSDGNLRFKPVVNKKSAALADNYRLRKMKNFIDEKNAE